MVHQIWPATLAFILSILSVISINPSYAAPLKVEAEDAADHHLSAQGTYQGGLPHSWEWNLGSKKSAHNITGISAHGLLAIYRLTGLDEHQNAALKAARSLIRAYDRGWSQKRPHTQDIEFLAQAGFIIDAARWFNLLLDRYPPHVYVDLVLTRRKVGKTPQVAAWDVASAIRAAVAVGKNGYARGLLDELVRRRGEWDRPGTCQDLARGSLLWALGDLRDRGGLAPAYGSLAAELLSDLLIRQTRTGAWLRRPGAGAISTQTTAYVILGLARWKAGQQAAAAGRLWLTRAVLTDQLFFAGGRMWASSYDVGTGRHDKDFNSEVQSEALMALATSR